MATLSNKSIKQQLLLPILLVTILMSIIIYNYLIIKNEENIVDSTVVFSKNSLNQYKYLRQYYNHEIISVLNKHTNAQIDVFAEKKEGMIPLPATLIQELSAYINKQNSGTSIKLYSDYPFPIREKRVLDSFEKKSIKFLNENSNEVFYQRSLYNGKDSVRVAIADVFTSSSCVNCHNSLSNSPKKDWKINDVGGVFEIIVSIEEIITKNKENTFYSTLIICFFLIVILSIIYILINNNILKPLNLIMQHIVGIKNGNLETKLITNKKNELDNLSLNIENMRVSLKSTIHSLKSTKNDLENSHIELKKSLENLKETQNQLVESEKMASLGGLVAGVSHEINTPVGIGLSGMSHFLKITDEIKNIYEKEEMSQEDFENYIKESIEIGNLIYSNLQRTAELVKSFKQVSVDQITEEKRDFNMKKYIEDILLSLNSVVNTKKIMIELKMADNIIINSSPGIFSQIITNFVMNSTIHAFDEKQSGLIEIECSEEDDNIILVYKDNGKGISKKNLKSIFDPFFTTNRKNGGTGLGLNIIYNLVVSKLYGTIDCNSKENEGVEFIIKFRK